MSCGPAVIGVAFAAGLSFLKGLSPRTWLTIGLVVLALVWTWRVYDAGYDAADAMWKAKNLEATIADIQAKLEANDEIRRQSDADAARAEAEAERLKELLETMSNDKSCPLTKGHVDGIGKIDNAK